MQCCLYKSLGAFCTFSIFNLAIVNDSLKTWTSLYLLIFTSGFSSLKQRFVLLIIICYYICCVTVAHENIIETRIVQKSMIYVLLITILALNVYKTHVHFSKHSGLIHGSFKTYYY